MYVKALEIQGFKSFPDKTVLQFDQEVTAIVGPNGSGKSNISDAIRWVMGEQSVRGLRGAKMEDVIFGGAEGRPPVGFAQVTLVLDNTEHIFPSMEEAEVAVTRRYYRSGESEYYINRRAVRLRDITDLFLDTGMGREGYSIIGQGKIDEILSVKSEERREVFEEAAGIARFRHRKEEAERKLQRTRENLVRVNDKIAELELQVLPLKDQAETAKRYLLLRDELRVLEISVWLENLDTLKANRKQLELELLQAQQCRDNARAELDALFADGERLSAAMREKDVEAERLRTEITGLDTKTAEQESAVAVLESTVAHHQENIRRAEAELTESDHRTGGIARQAEEQEQRAEELSQALTEGNTALDALLRQAKAAAEQADGAQARAEQLRAQEAEAIAQAADCRAELAAFSAESQQIRQRQENLQAEREDLHRRTANTQRDIQESQTARETAQRQVRAASDEAEQFRTQALELKRKGDAASQRQMQASMDLRALEDRIRMLSDMAREYEGFSKAVKLVCREDSHLHGIHGPVAGLMQVERTYALAIETALGAGLQNIVVDREEDAKAAIQFLKRRDGGRATFLPLNAIRGTELREPGLEKSAGFVGLASRLVRFDKQYQHIFDSLLGRTVVVENLDHGIAMARQYRYAFRIVTLDGQVLNRGGSMTGGSASRSTGVLSRSAELETLRGRTDALRKHLEESRQAADKAARELAASQYDLNAAEERRGEAEKEALRLQEAGAHLTALLKELETDAVRQAQEWERLNEQLADNAHRAKLAESRAAQAEATAQRCREQAEETLNGQSEQLAHSNDLAEQVTQRKSELASLSAQRTAALERAEELRRLWATLSGDRAQKQQALRSYQEQIAQAEQEAAQRRETLDALAQEKAALQQRISDLNGEKLSLEAQRTARDKASQEKNEDLLNQERSVSRLEQRSAAGDMEERQILDRLWEHYELSHTDAQAQRMQLDDVQQATRHIGELKRSIVSLGTPNLGAIEEFERVNTRYQYLTDQRDDVERAGEELLRIIREITNQMTDIFARQFELLSQTFQATFLELFGGGHATLELEDPKDILNCGIEIRAQPPGKTLRTISLLSGGEKAFVAIALYFAILKVHPTPFCVMDEIEAALDEANVTRFARYLHTLANRTQFITITHRRGTMEEADVLYGVTMQERGVSKLLRMDLNDLAQELNLK